MADHDSKTYLFEALRAFEEASESAIRVSESRLGIFHTGRQNRVLMAFAKMIVHAMSIQLLCRRSVDLAPEFGLLDHYSIGALTRTLIDASIMTLYLSEPRLTAAEWDLRRHVLFLHDATNRKRFLSAMHKEQDIALPTVYEDGYRQNKEVISDVIAKRGIEVGLINEKIEELLKGQLVFLDGVRGAVREAGLNVAHFEFMHTYLSNHVHSHPVSWMHAEKVAFDTPTEFQLGFCAVCLNSAIGYIDATRTRVDAFTGDESRDPNGHIE